MRSSVATGLAHLLAFWYLYSQYDGHAIARLPFEPFSFTTDTITADGRAVTFTYPLLAELADTRSRKQVRP